MSLQGTGKTYNLRKIERVIADRVEDQVLQLVHSDEQIIAERRHFGR